MIDYFFDALFVKDTCTNCCVGDPSAKRNYSFRSSGKTDAFQPNTDYYFTPARFDGKGLEKDNFVGTRTLWVDVDAPDLPQCIVPPSGVVQSGHGWHLYWHLDSFITDQEVVENANKALIAHTTGADKAAWNCNRMLRVPFSTNYKNLREPDKYTEPIPVSLHRVHPDRVYSIGMFLELSRINAKTSHKLRTGDRRGYSSSSERDWAVILALLRSRVSEKTIRFFFDNLPVGSKHQAAETAGSYLTKTINEALDLVNQEGETSTGFIEQEDGFYLQTTKGTVRLSTFVLVPKMLLDGALMEAEDALVCDVIANNYTWPEITFTKSAFNSMRAFDKHCPVAAWMWLGNDAQLRKLLVYLMQRLIDEELPRTAAIPHTGLVERKDKWYFVGTDGVLDIENFYEGRSGPVTWLPSKAEHIKTVLSKMPPRAAINHAKEHLFQINKPSVLWPIFGWYASSLLKPWLETVGYRFPVLGVTGTTGSGKTTILKEVMMPMFGHAKAATYDANTTSFVMRILLGSSNAMALSFSEFRYAQAVDVLRFILLSYDTGYDARGRPDQTTVRYRLDAPFTLDGEDRVVDPAARQRMVTASPEAQTVKQDEPAYAAFTKLKSKPLPCIIRPFIQKLLQRIDDGTLLDTLREAEDAINGAFKQHMPDRIRRNHIVAYFGALLFADFFGVDVPGPLVLEDSIRAVYDLDAQRLRLLVDDFVEAVINEAFTNRKKFQYWYDIETNVLWFQLSTSFTWWEERLRRVDRTALGREAIRSQLGEVDYAIASKVMKRLLMYGIDISKAHKAGLDVPTNLIPRVGTITLDLSDL